jgi:hypothetical protein
LVTSRDVVVDRSDRYEHSRARYKAEGTVHRWAKEPMLRRSQSAMRR